MCFKVVFSFKVKKKRTINVCPDSFKIYSGVLRGLIYAASVNKSKHLLKSAAVPHLTLLFHRLTLEDSIAPGIAKLGFVLQESNEKDDIEEEDSGDNNEGDETVQDSEEVEEVCLFDEFVAKVWFRNQGGL